MYLTVSHIIRHTRNRYKSVYEGQPEAEHTCTLAYPRRVVKRRRITHMAGQGCGNGTAEVPYSYSDMRGTGGGRTFLSHNYPRRQRYEYFSERLP